MAYDQGGYKQKDGQRGGWNSNQKNQQKPSSISSVREIDGYVSTPYYSIDSGGNRVPEKKFIGEYARKIADEITKASKQEQNKSTQIRKFFDYARRVESAGKSGNITEEEAITEIERLDPFVNYAKERDTVSPLFQEFISTNLKKIHNIDDLTFFVKHFEAVVGYSKKK